MRTLEWRIEEDYHIDRDPTVERRTTDPSTTGTAMPSKSEKSTQIARAASVCLAI